MSEYEPAGDGQEQYDGEQGGYGQSDYGHEPHSIQAVFTDGTSIEATDYNDDGVADLVSYDEDGDGTTDGVFVDTDGDGVLDSQFVAYGQSGGEYGEPSYAGAEYGGDEGSESGYAGAEYGEPADQEPGQYGDQGRDGAPGYGEPDRVGNGETGRADAGEADAGQPASQPS